MVNDLTSLQKTDIDNEPRPKVMFISIFNQEKLS